MPKLCNPDLLTETSDYQQFSNYNTDVDSKTIPGKLSSLSGSGTTATTRKRKSSTVTYNVNVINFQKEQSDDEENDGRLGGASARSNSSTSKDFLFYKYVH
jgi:hypothetical protein